MPNSDLSGNSYLYEYGTTPNTRVAVSQKVRLKSPKYGHSDMMPLGVVSSFSPSSNRSIEPVRGIGFGDRIAELVPGVTDPENAGFERALVYLCNLWQSMGYAAGVSGPVRSLRHHRWPFDVEQQMVFSTLADLDSGVLKDKVEEPQKIPDDEKIGLYPREQTHKALVTFYETCWFQSWSAQYGADQGIIMESGDIVITDVTDGSSKYGEFLPSGNDPSMDQPTTRRIKRSLPPVSLKSSSGPF